MPLNRFRNDRLRRTEAVLEILRRRAAQRAARGEAVPPALRAAIADADKRAGDDRDTLGQPEPSNPR